MSSVTRFFQSAEFGSSTSFLYENYMQHWNTGKASIPPQTVAEPGSLHCVFCIDTSYSMEKESLLEKVKEALQLLFPDMLAWGRTYNTPLYVSITGFSEKAYSVLEPTQLNPKTLSTIQDAIATMKSLSSTALVEGVNHAINTTRLKTQRSMLLVLTDADTDKDEKGQEIPYTLSPLSEGTRCVVLGLGKERSVKQAQDIAHKLKGRFIQVYSVSGLLSLLVCAGIVCSGQKMSN